MSSDPLNFFAAGEDSSDSDEEDDSRARDPRTGDASDAEKGDADKLPSPDSLFKSVGRPTFLKDPNEKFIDWDRFVKTSEAEEPSVHESEDGYAAIPPPASLAGNSGTVTTRLTRTILGTGGEGAVEFSSPPVTYDNGPVSSGTGAPPTTAEDTQQGVKRTQESASESEQQEVPAAKRAKGALFRVKEKRKRDIGQTSRGKSYVEEEKRILRQQFDSNTILS